MSQVNPNHRFIITKGVENTFEFIIKGDMTTLPIEVVDTDTVTAVFRTLSKGEEVLTKALDIVANPSGKVHLNLTTQEANSFESLRGGEEDRFYLRPNYSLTLICATAANGKFIAKVDMVYVD